MTTGENQTGIQEAKWLDKQVFDTNMHLTLHSGYHVNTSDTVETTMKGKIFGWNAAAREVGWRSKENETKISFQSCGKRTSELEMTTGDNESKIPSMFGKSSRREHSGAPNQVRHIRVCVLAQTEAEGTNEDCNEVRQPSKRRLLAEEIIHFIVCLHMCVS
ncbi:uncharacterized protein LOC111865524 [Cryptotermes secundus]|uniref:uncharacterized protein LOC111865524 n=1 Tax=Cryptotermes secundus TaxID=105785 RepID=UPI001454CE5B|nr:uncharacterized protein LOC111865524 [Cryptotermes secundus]XP_033607747.1 uncharacterized protein LOC111865524 [Cryptotermes secundus]